MQESNSNNFTWRDLFFSCIAHWKWFVISIAVCLAIAAYKLASSNEIYEVKASILIKTEDRNATARQALDAFNLMGLGNIGSNVHNELISLGSPTLMAEVIEQLRLNEIYTEKRGLRKVDLYKQEPVIIIFEKPQELPALIEMDIVINGNSEYEIKNFSSGKNDFSDRVIAKSGDSVAIPWGNIIISPSQHFTDAMVGRTVHFMRVEPMLIADRYAANLALNLPAREASVINISFSDESPVKAMDLVNTLLETYKKNWVQNQNAKINSISELVSDRISITVQDLNEADKNITSYMSKSLVSDFNQASNAYFTQNLELNKEILSYRTQVNIAESMLSSLSESEYLTLPANSGLADNSISSQIQEYNRLVLERDKLVANSGPNNSVVGDMTKSLQSIRKGVVQSLEGLIKNTNMIITSLEKQMNTSKQQLASTPGEANYLANVQREQKIKEELYLYLLEKKEENDLSLSFESDNSQIIVEPHTSLLPIKPNKRLTVLAALIAGFALPIAMLLLLALFDTAVHSKKDLETLKAPFLGEIPLIGKKRGWKSIQERLKNKLEKKKEDNRVIVKKHSRSIANESFRLLRSKLDFMNKSRANKVFMVSSLYASSGKSFISVNLAASYALKGDKVLVIDMDMRKASASKYLPDYNHKIRGLADFLSGTDIDYRDIIVKDSVMEGLDLIPVGTIPPNPAELVLSERLNAMMASLRNEYDYIFIDCPPINVVAESDEIARFADMALFVVRAGQFEKAMLPEIDELYNKKLFNNMVVLLNFVDGGSGYGHYGYGHYGYGHYGYGHYGYGYNNYYTEED